MAVGLSVPARGLVSHRCDGRYGAGIADRTTAGSPLAHDCGLAVGPRFVWNEVDGQVELRAARLSDALERIADAAAGETVTVAAADRQLDVSDYRTPHARTIRSPQVGSSL